MTPFTDKRFEEIIGNMLRAGVSLSALVVIVGGVLYLLHQPAALPDYSHFHPGPASSYTVAAILRGVLSFNPSSIIQLGIMLLIATPVVRVGFCLFGFARQRDLLYVIVSSAVLLILIYSLIRGSQAM